MSATPHRPLPAHKIRYAPPPLGRIRYVDLRCRDAAARLGMSCGALWAFLRRNERNGAVDLGDGVSAHRLGRKSWRVRFPVAD